MRIVLCAVALAALSLSGCQLLPSAPPTLSASSAALVDAGVRGMMGGIARDVTQGGPAAWLKYFSATPAFFMASEGHLEFPDAASATRTTRDLATKISQIDLKWGRDLRVDPLTPNLAAVAASWHESLKLTAGGSMDESGFFTGIAEYRDGRWQLRDAHWSVAKPPPAPTPAEAAPPATK